MVTTWAILSLCTGNNYSLFIGKFLLTFSIYATHANVWNSKNWYPTLDQRAAQQAHAELDCEFSNSRTLASPRCGVRKTYKFSGSEWATSILGVVTPQYNDKSSVCQQGQCRKGVTKQWASQWHGKVTSKIGLKELELSVCIRKGIWCFQRETALSGLLGAGCC